ncbi:GumC family protein [Bizionia sediminis]|uniref:non-specific protein-tyrosine kinase n=1 Tax=Bizionia sediminis TaxID=1737064 RepID=A0ABW5KVL2_9FLAO
MNKSQIEFDSDNEQIDIQAVVYRYLAYWPWILVSIVVMVLAAFLYLRYTPNSYNTAAKVKILTDKEATDLALDLDKILGKGNVNLENERAVLNSFRLNRQVVERLNLQVKYFQTGRVNERQVYSAPFIAKYIPETDTKNTLLEFDITLQPQGYKMVNLETGATQETTTFFWDTPTADFPFTLQPKDASALEPGDNPNYTLRIDSETKATQGLLNAIKITPDGKDSDILVLSLDATNKNEAQAILNTLIEVYTEDGILDRQEVSKRTISFIDERFEFLATELDSIEIAKGAYKQNNNLSIFQADAASIIEKRSIKDEQLFEAETQLLLANELEKSVIKIDEFELLPTNIGLNSAAINNLVADYNKALLEYNKWKTGAGDSNPQVKILKQSILDLNANIASSLAGYKSQLEQTLKQNARAQSLAQQSFSALPNKEKILRSIEREQLLKENLYLLLLQKREEAAINMAVTSANVKVIDYAITNAIPVAPKRQIILLGAFLLGVLVPVGILYVKFLLDTKIYTHNDVEALNPDAPVLGEIPVMTATEKDGGAARSNSQTQEAFRTLAHNLNFMQSSQPDGLGQVIAVTSSIKGEGKTTVSYNTAETYYQLKKRVLLVGADLRNPQLHPFINAPKTTAGLSNYLSDPDSNWTDLLVHIDSQKQRFDLLLSGDIPPMPSVLLASNRFKELIAEARKQYDYIIIDTAPTLLVADTLTFTKYVDFTLYVVRSGFTDKQLITYSKKLVDQKKLAAMGYVINDMNHKGTYGYGYNYGYGYGYHADGKKKPWYQFWN